MAAAVTTLHNSAQGVTVFTKVGFKDRCLGWKHPAVSGSAAGDHVDELTQEPNDCIAEH